METLITIMVTSNETQS